MKTKYLDSLSDRKFGFILRQPIAAHSEFKHGAIINRHGITQFCRYDKLYNPLGM